MPIGGLNDEIRRNDLNERKKNLGKRNWKQIKLIVIA